MHHSGQDKGPPVRANQMAAWEQWEYRCNQVNVSRWYPGPDLVSLKVDGVPFKVELDNGAPTGLMSETEFGKHWPVERLSADPEKMHMWSGAAIKGIRHCEVTVQVGQQEAKLPLLVAEGDGPFIMGRLWLDTFGFKVTGPVKVSRPVYKVQAPFQKARPSHFPE